MTIKEPSINDLKKKIRILEEEVVQLRQNADIQNRDAEKYRIIFEHANDEIIIIDRNGTVVDVNDKIEDIFGYKRREVIGKDFIDFEFINPEDLQSKIEIFSDIISGKTAQFMEFEAVHKDRKQKRFVEVNPHVIKKDGEVYWIIAMIRDITQRKKIENKLKKYREHLEKQVAERTDELANSNVQLRMEIAVRQMAENALQESEGKYRSLVENSLIGLVILQDFKIVFANETIAQMIGFSVQEIQNLTPEQIQERIHPDDLAMVWERLQMRLQGMDAPPYYTVCAIHRDGSSRWLETYSNLIDYKGKPAIQGTLIDITDRHKAEQELRRHRDHLKELVKEQTINLEEANAALRILLKKKDSDKSEISEKMAHNVRELIRPYISKLSNSGLNDRQRTYLEIIESNMNTIISPLLHRLSLKHIKLTPSEMQIVNLIVQGKRNKEMAELANLSVRTIETHRDNIRRKLKINNKKINLRTYLLNHL